MTVRERITRTKSEVSEGSGSISRVSRQELERERETEDAQWAEWSRERERASEIRANG